MRCRVLSSLLVGFVFWCLCRWCEWKRHVRMPGSGAKGESDVGWEKSPARCVGELSMELLLTLLLLLGLETEEEAPEGEGEVWADAGGLRDDGGVAGVAGGGPQDGDMAGDSSELKG